MGIIMCDQNESVFTPHNTFNEKIYFDFNLEQTRKSKNADKYFYSKLVKMT